MKQDILKWWS